MLDFANKTILVTGGTGSFGQRFVNFLLQKTRARRIIIFSRDELKQSQMKSEIADPENRLRFFIGDVRDSARLDMAFNGVDCVVHAAALKQVPALEYNPFEAVKTNIQGTQNVILAALNQKVEKVLLISTDKAANPANLYGATKLCAERLIVSANAYSGMGSTKFSVVRYGNVMGSRGSILTVLNKQTGGTVPLTHEDMTRFWITLDQGIDLVMMALEKMHGGEIFVPKIPSMKVKDFILSIVPDAKFHIIGIRPGEKLHEVLVTKEESRHTKEFSDHYIIFPEHDWWEKNEKYNDGQTPADDFHFSSHTNSDWLTSEQLKQLLLNV